MVEINGQKRVAWDEIQEAHGISKRTLERWLEDLLDKTGKDVFSSLIRGRGSMRLEDYEKLAALHPKRK